MPTEAVVCLVTAPPDDAADLATTIVADRLAACINILPQVHSVYSWQGQVTEDSESLLLIKTTRQAIPALDSFLDRNHPYDTFELVVLDIADGAAPYLTWIEASVDAS